MKKNNKGKILGLISLIITGIIVRKSIINNKKLLSNKIKELKNSNKKNGLFAKKEKKTFSDYANETFAIIGLIGVISLETINEGVSNFLSETKNILSDYSSDFVSTISDTSFDSSSCSSDSGSSCSSD